MATPKGEYGMSETDLVSASRELKPCPFCGSPGVLYVSGNNGLKEDGKPDLVYGVQCMACGMGYAGGGLPYDEALRLWNRRHGG